MLIDNENQDYSPEEIIDLLKEGNKRFVLGKLQTRVLVEEAIDSAKLQSPKAVILNCSDARVPAEHIFDQGINDIFNVRIAGNILNDDITGSIEYACKYLNVKLIVVLGHTNCGAVIGACEYVKLGNISSLINKIVPAIMEVEKEQKYEPDTEEFYDAISMKNVELTVQNITHQSYILNELKLKNKILIVGAMYNLKTGKVNFLD